MGAIRFDCTETQAFIVRLVWSTIQLKYYKYDWIWLLEYGIVGY